jgi:hypothetical protein
VALSILVPADIWKSLILHFLNVHPLRLKAVVVPFILPVVIYSVHAVVFVNEDGAVQFARALMLLCTFRDVVSGVRRPQGSLGL